MEFLRVVPPTRRASGESVAGHAGGQAFAVVGYSLEREAFRIQNSWGRGWGQNGRSWLPFEEAERLIHDEGEVCSALEQKVVSPLP